MTHTEEVSAAARMPDLVPVLSRGRHRNPRRGACFMEMASFLAGERWSDHPTCTHPLLAALARQVNDSISDAGRPQLAGLIPSVIGLTSDDPHVDALIAVRCATTALPVAGAERQRVLAVSVLVCERMLGFLDGRPAAIVAERSSRALEQVPHAAGWARQFSAGFAPSTKVFRRRAAPNTVRYAVEAIARACTPDPDTMLRDLLAGAINDCAPYRTTEPVDEWRPQWTASP